MIPYELHVALLIGFCLLFYKLLLQKETFHQINRWVLLVCIALSFTLPLLHIPQQWALRKPVAETAAALPATAKSPGVVTGAVGKPDKQLHTPVIARAIATPVTETAPSLIPKFVSWALWFYWCGVIAFGVNFLLQVIVLVRQAYKSPAIQDGQYRIIELDTDKAPCSFGNYIFINPALYDWDTYSQILLHEKIHIKQGHSFDLLLAELMLVFQWFNPFAWMYRKELENNLEYLTDDDVLTNNGVDREMYQMSLLKVSVPNLSLRITTNYNQSLLKKRIIMMNARRSNIHTTWKYFFLLPLMAFLMCAFNEPISGRRPVTIKSETSFAISNIDHEGIWTATLKGNNVEMQFNTDDGKNHMSNGNFLLSEFTSLPKSSAGDFKLVREAGTMNFNGRFDGNKGRGHYKFFSNAEYIKYMESQGISGIEKNDELAFFIINIKKSYLAMMHRQGYKNLSKSDLIATAALGVDEPYIVSLKQNGFPSIGVQDLITGKAMEINGAYIAEIRKAGYPNVSFEKLISFKAQGINGAYISKFKTARGTVSVKGKASSSKAGEDNADDMIAYKALGINDEYVNGLKKAGLANTSSSDLTGMKAVGVTPEYIQGFKSAGYNNISSDEYVAMKALGITPEFLNGFKNAGFKNINPDKAAGLKSLGVTPDYIKSFKGLGFNDISLDDATALKALGITPQYVTDMREKGFKSNDINKYISLKSAF